MAGEFSKGSALRPRLILREYTADLLMARGRPSDAVALLEPLLREAQDRAPHGDLVPEIARRLGSAYLSVGQPDRALFAVQLAIRTGRTADILEWAAGLRVAGECYATLGRFEESRVRFAEAFAVLEGTEFNAERARLEASLAALGMATSSSKSDRGNGYRSRRVGERGSERLELRDGRVYLTRDHGFLDRIRLAASDALPVFIAGETGTGKELVAHLLHELGSKPKLPFVVVDCTVLPETLAEAELFGAARGAYSGAIADREGLVAAAENGTLFFDELAVLNQALQAKLLRLLQHGTYRRLGESQERRSTARIVAATNRDPEVLTESGELKRDLFYRLNGHRLMIAPLRERRSEIGPLALEFAARAGAPGIHEDALELLRGQTWPGNIRELEMLIQVAVRHAGPGAVLERASLDRALSARGARPKLGVHALRFERTRVQREILERALSRHDGNLTAAARELGLTRQGFTQALRRLGLR
jgi:transcriptional regulator of acetoin/glycerol metabolism